MNKNRVIKEAKVAEIKEKCEGKPFRRLPLPKDISRRINFQ